MNKDNKEDIKQKPQESELLIELLDSKVSEMQKELARVTKKLNSYTNRQFTEIRVVEQNDKWGDYTGVFYLEDKETEKILINKAKKHFKKYFEDSVYHRNKRLGIFHSSPKKGKRLIEEIVTGE